MDEKQFLDALSKLDLKWEILYGRRIRARGPIDWSSMMFCPISAVTGDVNDTACARQAGVDKLGLTGKLAERIMDAADYNLGQPGREPSLRAKLLKACQLEETYRRGRS